MPIEMPEHSEGVEVTPELLAKYDRPGPRYTSYPTAPEWRGNFGAEEYVCALERASERRDEPLSLYVHVPFCRQRCAYCGCNTAVLHDDGELDAYIEYIGREAAQVAETLGARRQVGQLHWGGGTPTILSCEGISRLFEACTGSFEVLPDAQIALEADPRVTTGDQVAALRELGFNRVSMGVQDLDPCVQAAIGRNQTVEQTRSLFDRCRGAGFKGVNMDLVYGLPGQTNASWRETVRNIIEMRPDRLAVYSFAYLPERLTNQQDIDADTLPTGSRKYELFAIARRMFVEAGYRAIGMDHFALPGDELAAAMDERRLRRNFMGYTVVPAEDMVGLGASSIGEIGGSYAQNDRTVQGYAARLSDQSFATVRGWVLSDDDLVRRWVIRELMCNFHLDMAELERRFGVAYDVYFAEEEQALGEFYDAEFLERRGDALTVRPLGRVFIRNVAMVFDAYLRRGKGGEQPRFSRTV